MVNGGAFSRDKGARGERDVCAKLYTHLGIKFARNLKQYQQAQHGDIEPPCGPYLLEIKNCKTLAIPAWWRQTVIAAKARGLLPCLVFKDRMKWRFMVMTPEALAAGRNWSDAVEYTQVMWLPGFCLHVRELL